MKAGGKVFLGKFTLPSFVEILSTFWIVFPTFSTVEIRECRKFLGKLKDFIKGEKYK